ncbi:MAG: TIGR04255 family protein [Paraburkholderia tropica]
MGKQFPRALRHSPLVTSTAELRFSSDLPAAVLFGMLYTAERERYPIVEQLPASQLPPQMLQMDSNLQYQAHFALKPQGGGPTIHLGPKVFSATSVPGRHMDVEYLSGEYQRILEVFYGLGQVKRYERLGLRYINFFEKRNVVKSSTLTLSLEDVDLSDDDVHIRAQMRSAGYIASLSIMSNAQVAFNAPPSSTPPLGAKQGSLLDIDVSQDKLDVLGEGGAKKIVELFVGAHDVAKSLFFKSLKDDFITELGPIA